MVTIFLEYYWFISGVASFAMDIISTGSLECSKKIFQRFLSHILHSPVSFFDTTPNGRILNVFGKDIDSIDVTLPITLVNWIYILYMV